MDGEKVRVGVKRNQFPEGRHLSLVSGEGGFQPIVCFHHEKSVGEGFVSGNVVRF